MGNKSWEIWCTRVVVRSTFSLKRKDNKIALIRDFGVGRFYHACGMIYPINYLFTSRAMSIVVIGRVCIV